MTATTTQGGGGGRGPHPCRNPPSTTKSTAPSPPDRVLLLLTLNTTPRTTMSKRGAWCEYLSSGYVQWDDEGETTRKEEGRVRPLRPRRRPRVNDDKITP